MTLPWERYRSVERTRDFLESLIDAKKTPRVPRNVRQMALSLLRHFPKAHEMESISEKCPEIFEKDQIWYLQNFQNNEY